MRLLLLCGKRRVGKDTLADMLVAKHGYEKMHVAKPLKDATKQLFSLTDEQLYGEAKDVVDEHWNVTPRRLMQVFGTDLMQHALSQALPDVGRTFWITRLANEIRQKAGKSIVVADVRFQHEIDTLRRAFDDRMTVIMLQRSQPASSSEDAHESEDTDRLAVDMKIHNDGDRDQLWTSYLAMNKFGPRPRALNHALTMRPTVHLNST
jgi:hypothetical protein